MAVYVHQALMALIVWMSPAPSAIDFKYSWNVLMLHLVQFKRELAPPQLNDRSITISRLFGEQSKRKQFCTRKSTNSLNCATSPVNASVSLSISVVVKSRSNVRTVDWEFVAQNSPKKMFSFANLPSLRTLKFTPLIEVHFFHRRTRHHFKARKCLIKRSLLTFSSNSNQSAAICKKDF